MATTTNYGWTTPDDTALVKDGAAAIRTLGTSIDTTTFNNASAAIAKTIVDAKGDIIAATAADTVSRLAVGANDTVLTADSTAATGLKWATPAAGGMTLLSTTTLSGASTTISSISGAYTNLQVMIYGMTNNTNSQDLLIGFNGTTTGCEFYTTDKLNPPTLEVYTNQRIKPWRLLRTDANNVLQLNIFNYASSTYYKAFTGSGTGFTDSSTKKPFFISGGYQSTSAITSISFENNGGTWATGTVLIYGVK